MTPTPDLLVWIQTASLALRRGRVLGSEPCQLLRRRARPGIPFKDRALADSDSPVVRVYGRRNISRATGQGEAPARTAYADLRHARTGERRRGAQSES